MSSPNMSGRTDAPEERDAADAEPLSELLPEGEADQLDDGAFQQQITPVEAGETMVVQGVTNRKPDDNSISLEVVAGPTPEHIPHRPQTKPCESDYTATVRPVRDSSGRSSRQLAGG